MEGMPSNAGFWTKLLTKSESALNVRIRIFNL